MEIKYDESLLYLYNDMYKAGFTTKIIDKIMFHGFKGDEEIIKEFADYLEEHYKMYQYKKGDGVKFHEEELFYWHNTQYDNGLYFDVNIQPNYGFERAIQIGNEIVEYLKSCNKQMNGTIVIRWMEEPNWYKANDYMNNEFDPNNIDLDKIRPLYSNLLSGNTLTLANKDKLIAANNRYLKSIDGKKVSCILISDSVFGSFANKIDGKIKSLYGMDKGSYGLFKPRATKTYYPIDIGKIKSLEVIA